MTNKRMIAILATILMGLSQIASLAMAEDLELHRTINKRGEDLNSTYLTGVGGCYVDAESSGGFYYFCYDIDTFTRSKEYTHQEATLFDTSTGESKSISLNSHQSYEDYETRANCIGPANINNPARAMMFRNECIAARQSALRLVKSSNNPKTRKQTNKEGRR
jgi:hypothetical protein